MSRILITSISELNSSTEKYGKPKDIGVYLKNVIGYKEDSSKYITNMNKTSSEEDGIDTLSFINRNDEDVFSINIDSKEAKENSNNLITSGVVRKEIDAVKDYISQGGSGVINIPDENSKIFLSGTKKEEGGVSELYFNPDIYIDENSITAESFNGDLNGNSSSSDQFSSPFVLTLSGAVTSEEVDIDGSADVVLTVNTIDGTKIVGKIPVSCIPPVAMPDIKYVDTTDDMYTLTIDDVQNGDTVKVKDTGVMYLVKDDSLLNEANGYEEYKAGIASIATKLEVARTINGVEFDGTRDITIKADPTINTVTETKSITEIRDPGFYVVSSDTCSGLPDGVTNCGVQVIDAGTGDKKDNIQIIYTNNGVYSKSSSSTEYSKQYQSSDKPTLSDLGIGNIDNTSDMDKPVSNAVQAQLDIINEKIETIISNLTASTSMVHITDNDDNTTLGHMWINTNDTK